MRIMTLHRVHDYPRYDKQKRKENAESEPENVAKARAIRSS